MVYNPVSTYRIQFSGQFTFRDFEGIIPYLHKLGIKTIYASPLFRALPGSGHGYDVTDPAIINPEIGTIEELRQIHERLKSLGIGWIQDIVPNHMSFSAHNPWISDVLEKGKKSVWSSFFDIDWDHPDEKLNGKLMLPFFGKNPEELIEQGDLYIAYSNKQLVLKCFDDEYPLNFDSYSLILESIKGILSGETDDLAGIFGLAGTEPDAGETGKRIIAERYVSSERFRDLINKALHRINGSSNELKSIISLQHYVPVNWRDSGGMINYRRFFTVNNMICLMMDKMHVFDTWHSFIAELCRSNLIQGLRVDNIDGLYDPSQYLDRLRDLAGGDKYIIVEKILGKNESIETTWAVQGDTGYSFLALANNLLTCREKRKVIDRSYQYWKEKERESFDDILYSKKHTILNNSMAGDLENLTRYFVSLFKEYLDPYDHIRLKSAIGEFLVCCPVYKIYNAPGSFTGNQASLLKNTLYTAVKRAPALEKELQFLKELFLNEKKMLGDEEIKTEAVFRRFMQFSGALMAKGGEDTAYYTYNRFIAHNEVGDSPGYFGITADNFHEEMKKRQHDTPLSLNATSTHDTKRSEDARARLVVLSDIPGLWESYTRKWHKMNLKYKGTTGEKEIPCRNDEYFLYQTIAGFMPEDMTFTNSDFLKRLKDYTIKALREGKEKSDWIEPDPVYENGTLDFIDSILSQGSPFRRSLKIFLGRVVLPGIITSISQLIIKFTAPGTPDIYQGSETWNFSFVDPDNRRPVDFRKLEQKLDMICERKKNPSEMFSDLHDPDLKLTMTHLLLGIRNDHTEIFANGEYIPLEARGKLNKMVFAFARRYRKKIIIVIVPIHTGILYGKRKIRNIRSVGWADTGIIIPDFFPYEYEDILTGRSLRIDDYLILSELFSEIPFCILKGERKDTGRKAGILLHITSLPGKYPVGDFGEGAYRFADFLKRNGMACWQILPLNQVYEGGGYSPYSPLSAFAGNVSFINPDLLDRQGLISSFQEGKHGSSEGKSDYKSAACIKEKVVDSAYRHFKAGNSLSLRNEFINYREHERYWLRDYSLFIALKRKYGFSHWNAWPKPLRDRDPRALKHFIDENYDAIEREEYAQFLFSKQWEALKDYCNNLDIEIFGDVPIYVNYDSADVWSHPEFFSLKRNREMKFVAGVPPDYFSKKGQLWNMPVFRWDVMKKDGFTWWKNRIRKNLKMFDVLRLDHFRGFSACWEVPAGEETAINGRWVKVPGNLFFDEMSREFPDMPFVAEDLGQIDPPVYQLRDKYKLPGMRVLQFAFGEDSPLSVHIPHNHTNNCVVYTGTHDNNSVKGWFKNETGTLQRNNIKNYLGKKVNSHNCHKEMTRLAFSSVAKLTLIPLQDILGLDQASRMNRPSTMKGNWVWRLRDEELTQIHEKELRNFIKTYGRG